MSNGTLSPANLPSGSTAVSYYRNLAEEATKEAQKLSEQMNRRNLEAQHFNLLADALEAE